MAGVPPILWSEGMLLTPHHFQHDRLHREVARAALLAALHPYPWGLTEVTVVPDALANGVFRLERCSGLLRGALPFDLPGQDPLPEGRGVGDYFAPEAKSLTVYLGIPRRQPGQPAAYLLSDAAAPTTAVRWVEEQRPAIDENTGLNEQTLAVARGQWRLLFEGEEREGFDHLPIARLSRTAAGTLTLDPSYAPPALHLAAAPTIAGEVRGLLEQLSAKGAALSAQRRHRTRDLVEFGTADTAAFWLLNTVNSALPLVADLARTPNVHPYVAYRTLAQLAGALTTFATEIAASDVPPYRHDDLGATFQGFRDLLGRLLGTVVPTHCVNLPMEKVREWMYHGRADDAELFEKADFYLAVSADIGEGDLAREVQQKAKAASPDQIDALITSALPGIPIVHAPRPPATLPMKSGTVYFRLEPGAPAWTAVRASRSLALYLPVKAAGLRFEVVAIKG